MRCTAILGKKNHIWIAIDRYRKQFLQGNRGRMTCQKLWDKISSKTIDQVMTDHWEPYEELIHKEKHIQLKAETYTVDNSLVR